MSITFRLSTALVTAVLVALGVYALVAVENEEDELLTAGEREARLLSRSLQVSFENALRDSQTSDIRETLERIELLDPEVDIWVFDLKGNLLAQSQMTREDYSSELDFLENAKRIDGTTFRIVQLDQHPRDGDDERLLIATPLRSDQGEHIGGMVLGRSLSLVTQDLKSTRLSFFALMATIGLLSVLVAILLGRWLVGKPMRQLLAALARAREGDWTPGLSLRRSDEFGILAQEFNLLLEALAQARSERDQSEAKRRDLERTLEHADKLITVGQLSARFAHEIGSPLQVLVGRAQAISQIPDISEKVARHSRIIAEQGERISTIVRELLSWARPAPSKPLPVDPRAEVKAIHELLELEARRRHIRIYEAFDANLPEGPLIACRPGQLQQIIFNLVKNSLSATPEGGTITLGLALSSQPGWLVLSVSDTGSGVSEEHRARLFEPFFSAIQGGVGIGLSIVRAIASEHGATVELTSEPGTSGSCFTVNWPLLEGVP